MRGAGRSRAGVIAIGASWVVGCAAGEGPYSNTSGMIGDASSDSTGDTANPREDTSGVGDASFTGAGEAVSDTDAGDDSTGGCTAPQELFRDDDGDGWGVDDETMSACGVPRGWAPQSGDCDDGDADVHPAANEPCGGVDRDCDFTAPPLCRSCLQVLVEGEPDGDGLYSIDPDDDAGPLPPVQVWCDMNTDGGGWTLVQRTVWDPVQTSALRTGFASWRDVTVGNPSPAMGYRLQGAVWPTLSVQLEHLLRHVPRVAADGTSCDPLDYLGTEGSVSVTASEAFITGLVAPVPMINDDQLSTFDAGPSIGCVVDGTATPWFYGACCSTCPTYQGGYWPEPHPMFSYATTPDLHGNTIAEVCTGEPITTSAYWGLNVMEYYLR